MDCKDAECTIFAANNSAAAKQHAPGILQNLRDLHQFSIYQHVHGKYKSLLRDKIHICDRGALAVATPAVTKLGLLVVRRCRLPSDSCGRPIVLLLTKGCPDLEGSRHIYLLPRASTL